MSGGETTEKNNLHEGHRARMRERFRQTGFDGFDEHQVVELLLFYGCPRRDTNELAHILVNKFGGIAGIMDADCKELMSVSGVTENAATLFKIIPKCWSLYYNSKSDGQIYDNVDKIKELFKPYFIGLDHEEFRMACFDNNLRAAANWRIASGGPSSASTDMRCIAERAFQSKSSYVAIAHNHPGGTPVPSDEDIRATRMINDTLKSLGITLLDHTIIGNSSALSMREMGYMSMFE